jgi:phosphatidylinositol alpha-mannosyltransferase
MRVVLVCPYSWTCRGGVQSHVRGLAADLRGRGVEAWVVAPADGPADEPWVRTVGGTLPVRHNGSVVPVALSPTAVRRTLAVLGDLRPDVVHLHEPLIPAVSLVALLADAARVGTFHRYARHPGLPYRAFGPLCRAGAARLHVRIAVSEAARRHAAATCPGDFEVVPNGIRAGPEPAARGSPAGAGQGAARVAFVGRPDRRKGLPVLLDAFARLPGGPVLDLIGVEKRDLRRPLRRLAPDARGRVQLHGRVDDARRDALLRAADVFCCPALEGESFGIVVAEAMAAGLPAVVTDVGGVPELVGHDAGRVVPPGDPGALAAALAALLARPDERRAAGRAARARAVALDWSAVAARILELYATALARRDRVSPASPASRGRRSPRPSAIQEQRR